MMRSSRALSFSLAALFVFATVVAFGQAGATDVAGSGDHPLVGRYEGAKIVGHTDNKGTAEYNLDLSSRRATNVVAALTAVYGVAPDRLSSEGAGLTQPVASNDTEDGRAKNRRVELIAQ